LFWHHQREEGAAALQPGASLGTSADETRASLDAMTIFRTSLLLALCLPALGANRTIAQFVHKSWVAKDGAPASITAITQTNDGYLWLASAQGLYRFDGMQFERLEPPGQPFPATSVYSLFSCPNGDLWVGSTVAGISVLRNGTNRNYTAADGLPEGAVLSIAQDRQGAIWAAAQAGLARFDGERWRKAGPESGFEGSPISLYLDRQGTLWATSINAVFYLSQGSGTFHSAGLRTTYVMQMLESPNGTMWMAETVSAVRPMSPSKGPKIMLGSQRILFDRDGSLWITTLGDGLRRVLYPDRLPHETIDKSSDQLEIFTAREGLSADFVTAIDQDREGNIWVGTSGGLDRFSRGAVTRAPVPGKFTRTMMAPGDHGDVWVSGMTPDLGRVHDNQWFPGAMPSTVLSLAAGPDGSIWWAGNDRVGREFNGRLTFFQFPRANGPNNVQPTRIAVDRLGALWLAGSFGAFVLRGSEWKAIDLPSGFPGKNASLAYADAAGRVWFGYRENAMVLIDGSAVRIFSAKDGLQAGAVQAIFASGASIWIAGSKGLQLFDGRRFRDIAPAGGGVFGSVSGVLETPEGDLWLNAYNGIVRIPPAAAAKLKAGANTAEYTLFDAYDGLPGTTQQTQPYPTLIQATDGKLWFGSSSGPVWIDPKDLPRNELPAPVAIRSLTAKGKRYASFAALHLPALTRDVDFGYTAMSLTIPERVRFRYKLDGSDNDWHDAGTRRQASYTNLGPGPYRFRVMASNNDGVWNEAGAAVTFRIDAAFYQTIWFQAVCYAAGLALLWLLYRYRLQQATAQVHSRLEGRIAERERIARELHDTLLQSFQGLMLRLQVVDDLLAPGEAKKELEQSLERGDQAIAEGRRAVYDLRSSTTTTNDLKEALRAAADEFAGDGAPTFRLEVEGAARDLHPILRDEIYRIACEGLRNAFKHARARHVEAEITYGERVLRLRIRDDGDGIPQDILESGLSGHYGLRGMRERAQQNGASLEIWSRPRAGTEIDMCIPASIAYTNSSKPSGWRLFRRRAVRS
jgi:signal transduction histidine kinase/ligand-binding sensor domain-containing protein